MPTNLGFCAWCNDSVFSDSCFRGGRGYVFHQNCANEVREVVSAGSAQEEIGWYIADTHARRAIGYLSGFLPELKDVPVPELAAMWARAIEKTVLPGEPSPIGPVTVGTHR